TIGPQTDSWQPALTVVALGWLQEADRAKARYRPRTMNQQIIDFDAFGNPIYSYYSPYDSPGYPGAPQADGQALSLDQLLPTAPAETSASTTAPMATVTPRAFPSRAPSRCAISSSSPKSSRASASSGRSTKRPSCPPSRPATARPRCSAWRTSRRSSGRPTS